jgi:4-hydroxybenzoate polyprenyltransferase
MNPRILVPLFHIAFVVPLFLFVAYQRAATPAPMYWIFLILAAIIFIYHAYKAVMRLQEGSPYAWVNVFHVVVVAPLLAYIGLRERATPRAAYEILTILAFGTLGYHISNAVAYTALR